MATMISSRSLRRTTGGLFVAGAVTFAGAATVLSSTFDWPDILREPADVVLPAFVAGGTSLVWTWFATAWTYAVLIVPILMLPAALGRRNDPVLRAATYVGATSVVLSLIGFLRWVFVVPPLADSYAAGDATTRAAVDAAWTAQHQFGGALMGEHLGQLLAIAWSVTLSIVILRNTPSPTIRVPPPGDLSGDVAKRVIQVLGQHVNPSIAAHGGSAELVAVEQGTAYLRLGGGCQG